MQDQSELCNPESRDTSLIFKHQPNSQQVKSKFLQEEERFKEIVQKVVSEITQREREQEGAKVLAKQVKHKAPRKKNLKKFTPEEDAALQKELTELLEENPKDDETTRKSKRLIKEIRQFEAETKAKGCKVEILKSWSRSSHVSY